MYDKNTIIKMCNNDFELGESLFEGLNACLPTNALNEGVGGKLLTMAALIGSTLFAGCAAQTPALEKAMDVNPNAPVTGDSVSTLAQHIAEGIIDEMRDSSSVEETVSWKAAKSVYDRLVNTDKPLADMFSRIINRNTKDLSRPQCCDDSEYDNTEHAVEQPDASYDEETQTWEYN